MEILNGMLWKIKLNLVLVGEENLMYYIYVDCLYCVNNLSNLSFKV